MPITEKNDSSIVVRPATPDDAASVREMRLEALRLHPQAFSADLVMNERESEADWVTRLTKIAASSEDAIFIAEVRGGPAGMAGIYRGNRPKTRHNGTIWGVFVREAWRGRRVADGLVHACLDWGREQGLIQVKLAVVTCNTPAIRCYQRCGFIVYGLDPQVILWEGQYFDELLMVNQLV